MISPSYRPIAKTINAPRVGALLALLVLVGTLARIETPHAMGQAVAQEPDEPSPLARAVAFLRANPGAQGVIRLEHHERAHERTSTERGTLLVSSEAMRIHLEATRLDVVLRGDGFQLLDSSVTPPRLFTSRDATFFTAYRAIVEGADPHATLQERLLERRGDRDVIELVPRLAWADASRIVVSVERGGERDGRILRALIVDDAGNRRRIDLTDVRYGARLDARRFALPILPSVVPIEL